jgi:ubiquinone/menaquinone biosynthesis C-methylase UbiE
MDEPVERLDELTENLGDIELANKLFGVASPVKDMVRRTGAQTLLDVGCGSADIPIDVLDDAQRRGASLRVTCLDRSPQMLQIARANAQGRSNLEFVEADGMALPFADGAFDIATCNLALHHFDPPEAIAMLRELRRVAARTPLVCDLVRSPLAYIAVLAYSRLVTRNRLTRHDGPLSVRRAYTPNEAHSLALAAGWRAPVVSFQPFFRMTLHDI